MTFRVYADLGLEDLYHGLLCDNAASATTAATNGTGRKRSKQTRTKATTDATETGDEPHSDLKSVALNVELLCDFERPAVASDVTPATPGQGPKTSRNLRKPPPERQRATGVDATCRPLSQNEQTERVGFDLPGFRNQFSSGEIRRNQLKVSDLPTSGWSGSFAVV